MTFVTGTHNNQATCSTACWQAKTPDCDCICEGAQHGVMRNGGAKPQRICQRKGVVYELEGVYGDISVAFGKTIAIRREAGNDHFAAFDARATASQRNWLEALAVEGHGWRKDKFLVWRRKEAVT